jgi:mRNA-degrading endonuclease RelE of RelBE toxin-antitoxin system
MIFIETPIFTKEIQKYLTDDQLRMLQSALALRPDAGDLIPGSGGLRKIRWAGEGRGKRGGLRIIYYIDHPDTIYLLLPYKKSKKEDLSREQIKMLRKLIEEYLK